jgi:hypothetical protein
VVAIAPSAAMLSALHTPVPSSTLLKFLRSQSEICFFSPSTKPGFTFDHAAPRATHAQLWTSKASVTPSARCLSTAATGGEIVEANFLNLEFLWPRSSSSVLDKEPQSRAPPRNKKSDHGGSLTTRRTASSRLKPRSWIQRLWGNSAAKGGQPLRPDDLPQYDGSDSSPFNLKAAQPKLRCTELDENGKVVFTSGEFKKTELIAKVRSSIPLLSHSPTNTRFVVWPPSPRSSQNRLKPPPPHSRPTLCNSRQPPPPPSAHQSQPGTHLRSLWDCGLVQPVRIHI